jgi:hypothetical protein
MCNPNWARKYELPLYGRCHYIAEYWNTLSNLPFIVIGSLRLGQLAAIFVIYLISRTDPLIIPQNQKQLEQIFNLYFLYMCAGICSAFHHAHHKRWTIVIDWIPIASSLILLIGFWPALLSYITVTSWCKLVFAMCILINDHIITTIPVPFGHVMWHIVASFAIDSAYQDMYLTCMIERQSVK